MTDVNGEFLEALGLDGKKWLRAKVEFQAQMVEAVFPQFMERVDKRLVARLVRKFYRRCRYQRRYARIGAQMGGRQ